MNLYSAEAAGHVMEYGVELFESMTGFKPLAYRAGAFRYNARILEALHACKIPLSFQYSLPGVGAKTIVPAWFRCRNLALVKMEQRGDGGASYGARVSASTQNPLPLQGF